MKNRKSLAKPELKDLFWYKQLGRDKPEPVDI